MNATRRGMLCMIAFALLWALVEVFASWLSRPYSPYQVVWARYGSHLAIMLAIWGWRDPLVLVRTRRPALQIARSLLMLVMPAAWIFHYNAALPRTPCWPSSAWPHLSCARLPRCCLKSAQRRPSGSRRRLSRRARCSAYRFNYSHR